MRGLWFWRLIRIFWFVRPLPRHTQGFQSWWDLAGHYGSHVLNKSEFPLVLSQDDYLYLADCFLGKPLDATTLECQRTNLDGSMGDVVRYNTVTQEFGILSAYGIIRTYFMPDPAEHSFPTNEDYFRWNC